MTFSNEIQKAFKKAGWIPGRDIRNELVLLVENYPSIAFNFLKEYGNLEVECATSETATTKSMLSTYPDAPEGQLNGDNYYPYYSKLLNQKLFPIGSTFPDTFHVCCDNNGRIYTIGEYCYYWGESIQEGIENIIRSNWREVLQLDEETSKWWNIYREYVSLP